MIARLRNWLWSEEPMNLLRWVKPWHLVAILWLAELAFVFYMVSYRYWEVINLIVGHG